MPAYSKDFPWPPHYGEFDFFEDRMIAHGRVADLTKVDDGLYDLTLKSGKTLRVFICECYSFGVAEYKETVKNIGEVDVVVINSNWCGYTSEAKGLCRDLKVGLFKIPEFMGALNKTEFWTCVPEAQEKQSK